MAYYALAPLLCVLLFLFSGGSAFSEESLQITLYLDRTVDDGPNRTAIFSVGQGAFGSIHTRDRLMFDGPGPNANIIGRALSVNFKTKAGVDTKNIWSISLNLMFDDGSRFSGSTLQVAGVDPNSDCEWSIAGGTGKLGLARGIIRRRLLGSGSLRAQELTINAYYSPVPSMSVSGDIGPE